MLIFGVFVLLPLAINVLYSFTGGPAIFLENRTFVGLDQYRTLFDCEDYLAPLDLPPGRVLAGRAQHRPSSSSLQVAALVVVSLVTALVLNREMRARGFWRAVFFFPVLLSPVVVGADLEVDPAARGAAQRRARRASAASARSGWPSPAGRCSGRSSSPSGRISASTR